MTSPVIDLITFKAAKGTAEAEIRQAAETSSAFLRGCPGFLSRQLSHDPATDTWADVVSWTDRASAQRAAAASRTLPEAHALTHLAAISTLTELHLDAVLTAWPGSLAFVPRGLPHTAWNSAGRPMRGILLLSPGGAEHLFEPVEAP